MNRQTKLMESLRTAQEGLKRLQAETAALLSAPDQERLQAAASAVDALAEPAEPLPSAPEGEEASRFEGLPASLDGEALGRLVTRTVNDEIGRAARRRRYTG